MVPRMKGRFTKLVLEVVPDGYQFRMVPKYAISSLCEPETIDWENRRGEREKILTLIREREMGMRRKNERGQRSGKRKRKAYKASHRSRVSALMSMSMSIEGIGFSIDVDR